MQWTSGNLEYVELLGSKTECKYTLNKHRTEHFMACIKQILNEIAKLLLVKNINIEGCCAQKQVHH